MRLHPVSNLIKHITRKLAERLSGCHRRNPHTFLICQRSTNMPKDNSRNSPVFLQTRAPKPKQKKVCAWCGTSETPEFRSGPNQSVLCNKVSCIQKY